MGCWNETCGLTNLPIYAGDECVMVVLNSIDGTPQLGYTASLAQIHYASYVLPKLVRGIYIGRYDDYGWLEDMPDDTYAEYHTYDAIFFHKKAWQHALKCTKEHATWYRDDVTAPKTKLMRQFYRVFGLQNKLRINIFSGLAHRGSQEWHHPRLIKSFRKLQDRILEKL